MAQGDIEDEVAGSPAPPGGDAPDPSAGGGGPPGAGGPMMAALARHSQQPPVSAPGPGNNADAMNKVLQALQMIQQAQVGLQPGTPLHKDVVDAVKRLSRHLPAGAPTAGVQMTGLRDMLKQVMQGSFLPMILQQLRGGGGGGGGPAGAQPNMAPMPSMPLPGA